MPPNVVEGRDVLLLVHNMPENLRSFSWYKGVAIVSKHEISRNIITSNRSVLGPAHSGRETVYSNGSLLLHNATQKDTGLYTLLTLNRRFETQGIHVHIHIYSKYSLICVGAGGVESMLYTQDCQVWTMPASLYVSPCWSLRTQCRVHIN